MDGSRMPQEEGRSLLFRNRTKLGAIIAIAIATVLLLSRDVENTSSEEQSFMIGSLDSPIADASARPTPKIPFPLSTTSNPSESSRRPTIQSIAPSAAIKTMAPMTAQPNSLNSASISLTSNPSSPAPTSNTPTSKAPTTLQPSTLSPTLPSCPAADTLPLHVMISDEPWGQTCNVLHMTTAAIRLARNKYNSSGIALGPDYGQYLTTASVDLEYYSSHNISLFINCNVSTQYADCVECGRWFFHGTEVAASGTGAWKVPIVFKRPLELWFSRTATTGFQQELLYWRLTKQHEVVINSLVQRIRDRTPGGWPLVSVHRRSMDGLCYAWLTLWKRIQTRSILECHSNSSAVRGTPFWINQPLNASPLFQKGGKCYQAPNKAHRMNLEQRQCYWDANPWYNLCEIILSNPQKGFFRNISSTFPRDDNFGVILATDRQMGDADQEFFKNHNQTQLLESVDANVTKLHRRTLLLWEMWALAQGDFFISQPLSTCDTIISIWRFAFFNKSAESVFPPNCWDKYKDEVDVWRLANSA